MVERKLKVATSRYVTLCVTVRLAIRCHSKRHNIILGNALRFSVRIPAETNSSLNKGSDSSTVKRSEIGVSVTGPWR